MNLGILLIFLSFETTIPWLGWSKRAQGVSVELLWISENRGKGDMIVIDRKWQFTSREKES